VDFSLDAGEAGRQGGRGGSRVKEGLTHAADCSFRCQQSYARLH
jgi:hypothetical protein